MMIRKPWVDLSKHNGASDGAKIRERGFVGVMARCTIGKDYFDPFYEHHKIQAQENDLDFIAYGVHWPINRTPEEEAEWLVTHLETRNAPKMPRAVVGDFELGLQKHWAGHNQLSGKELIEHAIRWMERLDQLLAVEVVMYSAAWYWNSSKLMPYINRGEKKFRILFAHYPFDSVLRKYSPDVLDPDEVNPNVKWRLPAPWDWADVFGIQWTDDGRGRLDGYVVSDVMDRDILFVDFDDGEDPKPKTYEQTLQVPKDTDAIIITMELT